MWRFSVGLVRIDRLKSELINLSGSDSGDLDRGKTMNIHICRRMLGIELPDRRTGCRGHKVCIFNCGFEVTAQILNILTVHTYIYIYTSLSGFR